MRRALPVLGLIVFSFGILRAAEDAEIRRQLEELRNELQVLRQQTVADRPVAAGHAEALVGNKYGPDAPAATRQAKLVLGGLAQIWYYSIQNDNQGWVDQHALNAMAGPATHFSSNETNDNDSFALRRMRLLFTMDLHENVQAFMMLNTAAGFAGRTMLPATQFPFVNAGYSKSGTPIGSTKNAVARTGVSGATNILEEAWIQFHDIVPHHEFRIGQSIRPIGEEGPRPSGLLDFTERAMINVLQCIPDSCAIVHGLWWDNRFQYWLGMGNGAGTAFELPFNRADHNDEKEFLGTAMVRPVWKNKTWGSLELGATLLYGRTGEAHSHPADANAVDGVGITPTDRRRIQAWAAYFPGGPVKGWWLRGEWGTYRDRWRPNSVISFYPGLGSVSDPATFDVEGFYVGTGYKLADSVWADEVPAWLKPCEFTFRYDTMENLFYADLNYPSRRQDVFSTTVWTAGLNYYLKGHNAKVQINYNWVDEQNHVNQGLRQVREVRNDNLVVNFQVGW
jgi:hypothetical protein